MISKVRWELGSFGNFDDGRVTDAMTLVGDDILERSAVVANCRMNRERDSLGSNGYDRELGFNPLDALKDRLTEGRDVAWLDLCRGTGGALVQAAEIVHSEGFKDRIEITGVDLVGHFVDTAAPSKNPRLVVASLARWEPARSFDLISCVHGLHYVGDKLDLIARAVSWLAADGIFVASFDLANVKTDERHDPARVIAASLRRSGLTYDRRDRQVTCRGRRVIDFPFRSLGADDQAGPNDTGQPAVTSRYSPRTPHGSPDSTSRREIDRA